MTYKNVTKLHIFRLFRRGDLDTLLGVLHSRQNEATLAVGKCKIVCKKFCLMLPAHWRVSQSIQYQQNNAM